MGKPAVAQLAQQERGAGGGVLGDEEQPARVVLGNEAGATGGRDRAVEQARGSRSQR